MSGFVCSFCKLVFLTFRQTFSPFFEPMKTFININTTLTQNENILLKELDGQGSGEEEEGWTRH